MSRQAEVVLACRLTDRLRVGTAGVEPPAFRPRPKAVGADAFPSVPTFHARGQHIEEVVEFFGDKCCWLAIERRVPEL